MGYWIAALLLVAFGFITGFSIGPPFLLVGLAMLVLGPLRRWPRLYWPPLVGLLAFIVGVVLVVPMHCTATAEVTVGRRIAMKRLRPLRLAALLAVALLVAVIGTITVPPLLPRDEPVPARVAPYLADARASLFREAVGILPLHLRFAATRCHADGGALLVFEQWQRRGCGSQSPRIEVPA
jgi:hypothetical protein